MMSAPSQALFKILLIALVSTGQAWTALAADPSPGDDTAESSPSNFGAKGYCEVGDGDSGGFDKGSRLDCGASQEQDHGAKPEDDAGASEKPVNPRIPAALLPMMGKPSEDDDD